MSQLTLSFLGPPQIEMDGKPVMLERRKATALLVYLVVTQQLHSRDTLATLLWPEQGQQRARANLRNALLTLNQALGEGWLRQERETLAFAPDDSCWVDVHRFQQLAACRDDIGGDGCTRALEEAVELYRADFLAGFSLRDSAEFDDWQSLEAEHLRGLLVSTLERLVVGLQQVGNLDSAIAHARRWVASDPLGEAAQGHLIRLYGQTGQTAAALRQYHAYAALLHDELAAPPPDDLTALVAQIKVGNLPAPASSATSDAAMVVNLPPQPTLFVGRELEIRQISGLLTNPDCRLLTLVGPGGVGKTRLAIEAAGQLVERFGDGVVFVSLSTLATADRIPDAVASAIGRQLSNKHDPETTLLNYLRDKSVLLILDNFEHLVRGAALLSRLLAVTRRVQILVTSRERLHLQEEWLVEVQGLNYPASDDASDGSYSALQLFEQTARRLQPDFQPDTPSVARICDLVDGLPLGIMLAASWIRLLTCAEIEHEISRSIGFLETTLQNIPARHRSMRAVLDHSWALLTEAEQAAFARLAVFRGGFRREAAAHVTEVSLYTLLSLVDKSLLHRDSSGRYDMHTLLRQYAGEKIGPIPPALQRAHAGYYADFIATGIDDDPQRLAEIEVEYENILAGWDYAVQQAALPEIHRIVTGLWHYYNERSWYRAQEEDRYRVTLDILGDQHPATAAWIHESLGQIRTLRGDYDEALELYQAALRHAAGQDPLWEARLLRKQANARQLQHELADALRLYQAAETALESAADAPSRWREWLMINLERMWALYWQNRWQQMVDVGAKIVDAVEAYAAPPQKIRYLMAMGAVILRHNRYANVQDVIQYSRAALDIALESGSTADIAWITFTIGLGAVLVDDLDEGIAHLQESLAMTEHSGDIVLQSRCLNYLTMAYRKQRQRDLVRQYAERTRQIATAAHMQEYVGMACANDCWLAWCEGDAAGVERYGEEAFAQWGDLTESHASVVYCWMALFPMMDVASQRGQVEKAIEAARVILQPSQQRLPDALTAALENAVSGWQAGETESASQLLQEVLQLAQTLNYL